MNNDLFILRSNINAQISRIPKKNKKKFQDDYLKLIRLAQKDDYENFNF